ncbi:hypothetical protein [Nakamurella aerolata]|uniref:Uncharacterized protein n=1 Tax=Nakamurella aerolata TaxID=1656892 RepID=A0A849A9Y3_9ACTN|nr:hypothetical protein [Nakamurella aerolata]NNG36413.1 hypothetical protein [Nakamurella aerolata]
MELGLITQQQAAATPDDCPIALVIASDISTPVDDDYVEFDAEHYWNGHDSSVDEWLDRHLGPASRLLATYHVPVRWRLIASIADQSELVIAINDEPLLLASRDEDEQGWRAAVRLYRHLDALLQQQSDRRLYLATGNDRMGWVFCWTDAVNAAVRRADPDGAPEPVSTVPIDPAG